jgi:site-specific recombinase XerD
MSKASMSGGCTALRAFLRYAHREGALPGDLSTAIGQPQVYRLADLPRSISWAEVGQMPGCVDRRTAAGKRDYAMLVLMAAVTHVVEDGLGTASLGEFQYRTDLLVVGEHGVVRAA